MSKAATTSTALPPVGAFTELGELLMPAEVTDKVHALARRARANHGLTFTDSDGADLDVLFPDDGDDSTYNPDDDNQSYESDKDYDFEPGESDSDDSTTNSGIPATRPRDPVGVGPARNDNAGVNEESEPETEILDEPPEPPGVEHANLEAYVEELEAKLDGEIAELDSDYAVSARESDDELDDTFEPIGTDETESLADPGQDQADVDVTMPQLINRGAASDDSDSDSDDKSDNDPNDKDLTKLRRNCTRNYGHLKGRDSDGSLTTVARPEEFRGGRHQAHVILQSIIMTQYNLMQGIKKFGYEGKQAVLTELRQLYDRDVMEPVSKYDLTPTERKGALCYLMFLKEKRCGLIKGRGCADGRKQRETMSKEDTSLPTVATESLMLTCIIDAIEGRDVATVDLPGAFMQSWEPST
jgi:hypothetical protein